MLSSVLETSPNQSDLQYLKEGLPKIWHRRVKFSLRKPTYVPLDVPSFSKISALGGSVIKIIHTAAPD